MKLRALAFVLSAILLPQAVSAATFTLFTDRTSFEAALTNQTVEDFNSVIGEPSFLNTDLTFGDMTVRNDGGGRGAVDQSPFNFTDIDGTALLDLQTDIGATMSYSFSHSINAFGVDLSSFNDSLVRTAFMVDGQQIDVGVLPSGPQFFGFISDMTFDRVETVSFDGDGYRVDNVTWQTAAPIPVPAGGVLLLTALGLGAAVARRRA